MKRIMSLILLVIAFCSCSTKTSTTNDEESVVCHTEELSFKTDVLPIFESNCFSCHSEENYASDADGNLMVGYADIKKYLDEGLIMGNIEHRAGFLKMPYRKAKLDDCDIDKIKAWVKAGALDN